MTTIDAEVVEAAEREFEAKPNTKYTPPSKLPALFGAVGARDKQQLHAQLERLTDDELARAYRCWELIANPYQLPPPDFAKGLVRNWMLVGARAVGKNVASANWLCEQAERETEDPHLFGAWMLFVGVSYTEAEKAMTDPDAGLIAISNRRGYPATFDARKRLVTWPNGVRLYVYGSFEASTLRGKNFSKAVLDEWMFWPRNGEELCMIIMAAVRAGKHPQIMWTCNPNNKDWCKRLVFHLPSTVRTHAKTRDNIYLGRDYVAQMETSLGSGPRYLSEVLGEFSDENENALVSKGDLAKHRVYEIPSRLERVVIAVDPASSDDPDLDEHGIVVLGLADGHVYALEDASGNYDVVNGHWARVIKAVYERWLNRPNVDRCQVGAEVNNGWAHVVAGIRVASPEIHVIKIVARDGKMLRAEPVGGLIHAGLVHLVGYHHRLESELTSWIPNRKRSPNRLDAFVHGVTELMLSDRAAKSRSATTLTSYAQ